MTSIINYVKTVHKNACSTRWCVCKIILMSFCCFKATLKIHSITQQIREGKIHTVVYFERQVILIVREAVCEIWCGSNVEFSRGTSTSECGTSAPELIKKTVAFRVSSPSHSLPIPLVVSEMIGCHHYFNLKFYFLCFYSMFRSLNLLPVLAALRFQSVSWPRSLLI